MGFSTSTLGYVGAESFFESMGLFGLLYLTLGDFRTWSFVAAPKGTSAESSGIWLRELSWAFPL